ncbi:hypothetical protein HG530_007867 [Fusarium avenaceum]|nr:hypothetical protein HG530_007867 [Fusarium avenaceum]
MQTDWRENSRLSDPNPARASRSPSSSQSNPQTQTQQKNSLACERCFKRKQKCDRLRPACTSCADLGVECVARSQQFDFSVEDAGLTHARVNGYVESLRRRVAELEQKVNAAEQKHILARRTSGLPEVISPITGKRRRSTEAHINVGPGTETSLANGDEQSTVEDTMSAIGLLSNKAMAESRVNTSNEPHKLSIIESISAALAVDGRDPSTASTSQHSSLVDGQLIPLTRDLTLSHMQRFINWGVWLPYIDEDHLMEQYNKVLDRNEQIGNPDQAALPHFNTYLAIAIGISMSPDTNRFSALAMNLHAEAVKLLPSILHSQEPLDTLHCMLLLAVFSMFSPSGGSTWHLMGFIMTNCIASGLHKTAIPQARLGGNSSYRVEWLFWTVYLWDRCISSCMGRPFSISDDDISVSIPEAPANDNESDLPAQVRSKLALSRHLLVHAQLTSDICGGKQPITHTSSAPTNSLLTLGDSPEIETDTVSSSTVSFLDAYTILAAAVIYLCLVQRMPQPNQQEFARTFEVVSKASVLLTQCSTRFAAMNVFQQFLLSLSTKIMEGQGSLQVWLRVSV